MVVLMGALFVHKGLSKTLLVLASANNAQRTQTPLEAAQGFLSAYATVGTQEMGTNVSIVLLASTSIPVLDCVSLVEAVTWASTFTTAK